MKIIHKIMAMAILSGMILTASSQEKQGFQSERLVKKWETGAVFEVPESVCYDPVNQVFYVSNIVGKPTDKDGNGYISKIGLDGTIAELKWVTGLNAPKGMGIYKNKLYVTDIDRVAVIDIESMMISGFYDFQEAKFLNDIDIDRKGAIYISDMMTTRIYRIYDGRAELWLDDDALTGPNGLFVEDGQLLAGCKRIVKINVKNKEITEFIGNTGGIDGLEGTGDGNYLFSDWQGNIFLAGPDGSILKLLDTTPLNINAADIEYVPSLKLLLVPTFYDNRVMAYELN